ncbi:MAG: hypothetical protein R3B52_03025 [Candidatus Paceibacterota bacterium]
MEQKTIKVLTGPIGLLQSAWKAYKENFSLFITISAIGGAVGIIALFASPALLRANHGAINVVSAIFALVVIVAQIWASSSLSYAVTHEKQIKDYKKALLKGWKLFVPYLLVTLLVGLITALGLVLLIIPGVIFAVWLAFSVFILMDNEGGIVISINKSKAMVKGYWWPVFGRLLALIAATIAVMAIVGAILSSLFGQEVFEILNQIISILITPLVMLYVKKIYDELKA